LGRYVTRQYIKIDMKLKAISVRQPWANAIMQGKDVENRSRYFSHRGSLLIHASLKVDGAALSDPRILGLPINDLVVGHLIGVVTVLDCVRSSNSRWADPGCEWKLLLASPRPLLRPVPYRGQLALFEVDHELLRGLLPPAFENELPPGMLALR
jgi:ASCH domain